MVCDSSTGRRAAEQPLARGVFASERLVSDVSRLVVVARSIAGRRGSTFLLSPSAGLHSAVAGRSRGAVSPDGSPPATGPPRDVGSTGAITVAAGCQRATRLAWVSGPPRALSTRRRVLPRGKKTVSGRTVPSRGCWRPPATEHVTTLVGCTFRLTRAEARWMPPETDW